MKLYGDPEAVRLIEEAPDVDPNPMTQVIGSECLKDAAYALTRTTEILRDLRMTEEANEVAGMVRRLGELHAELDIHARAGLEKMNRG